MLNSSFNSDTYSRNLSKQEHSILKEYKRLAFGEESVQYSVKSIHFEDLPDNFPEEIFQGGRKCVRLSGVSFFEMLTYSVWQFLLSNRSNQKTEVIKKIRKQIAEKTFMQDSPSTKGLLVKGIKQMHDQVQLTKSEKLIAHCMWKTDSMLAFTEFWKSLLSKLSVRNVVTADLIKDLDVGLFQLLADFLQINFCVYYQNLTEFQKEVYLSQQKKSSLRLDLIVYGADNKQARQDCSRVLESSLMLNKSAISQSVAWNYIILEDVSEYYRSSLQREDISEIKAVDESVQDEKEDLIKLLKLKTRSQINLQKPANLSTNTPEGYISLSPHSEVREIKRDDNLETTRARKSQRTTDHKNKSEMKKSTVEQIERIQRISFQETQRCLDSIRTTIQLGGQLINELKEFCNKIAV